MEKQWDILGIGSAAVDDLLFINRFPQPDEKIPVQARQRRCGGQTSTALVAAARHGAKVAFYSCFGEDDLSRYLLQALENEGVDCSLVIHDPHCTPIHSIIIADTSTGSRTILYYSVGFLEPRPEAVEPDWIRSSRMVFIDQNVPSSGLQGARFAHDYGIPVIADLEYKSGRHAEQILPLINHLIVGIDFARQTTGKIDIEEMTAELVSREQAACVITGGNKGCWYSSAGQPPVHFPAFQVTAVDTTGCGDVFHGVYAAAIVRGESVPRAVEFAAAAAAMKAAHHGGWAGIPTLAEVEVFLKSA